MIHRTFLVLCEGTFKRCPPFQSEVDCGNYTAVFLSRDTQLNIYTKPHPDNPFEASTDVSWISLNRITLDLCHVFGLSSILKSPPSDRRLIRQRQPPTGKMKSGPSHHIF